MEEVRIDTNDALRAIARTEEVLRNPKPFLQMIAEELYRVARVSFETESSPDGAAWKPLSRRYAAWKTKRFPGRGMLRLSGRMIRTLHRGVTDKSAWVSMGPLEYAAMHQYGFNGTVNIPEHSRKLKARGRGKKRIAARTTKVRSYTRHMFMPARPVLGFSLDSQQRMVRDITEQITDTFNGKAGN